MSIIKRIRKEFCNDNGIATIYLKTYFLGIPIYEDIFDSSSNAVLSQFIDFNVEQPTPTTGLYDVTDIGFKQEQHETL